jgi:hypothetical protein
MFPRPIALASLCALMLHASPASAAPITIRATGVVDFVPVELAAAFSVGDTFTALYTFESTTPPRGGSTSVQAVFDAVTVAHITIGSYTASAADALPNGEIQVDNGPAPGITDRYAMVTSTAFGLVGPSVGGRPITFAGFRMDDSTNAVFSDALILPLGPSLSDFDSSAFFVFFDDVFVFGHLTSITQVPEPVGGALIALGLAAMAVRRQRSRG